ncbi:hypothetical protein HYH03_003567 [Edaphochlamys debaryana]|uniref:Serine/threonine-protein kinase n=1 Tax=Edaphochlamys debaryana TaxID=47281 RepID=A0A835YCI8_9CHLO|nr:hypothetical protein HYH03_003567 [Edaphochlamys debaryana]|eukprot:KAG2498306.1 hypothetical protein HYH03_003567 [Edaphochlamys debaryana]
MKGPIHGRIPAGTEEPQEAFSLNVSSSWGLTAYDRITAVSVCCKRSNTPNGFSFRPQLLRLWRWRGTEENWALAGVRNGSTETVCSSWDPVPYEHLLAGVIWQEEADPPEGMYRSARIAFIYAEPSLNTWVFTGPWEGQPPYPPQQGPSGTWTPGPDWPYFGRTPPPPPEPRATGPFPRSPLAITQSVQHQLEVLALAGQAGAIGAAGPAPAAAGSEAASAPELRFYTVDAIHAATQGFSDARLVGRGPSGSAVYRGELDGAAVAVKRMGPAAPGAVGPDLEAAARVLASLQLPHVLRVLGCCPEQHVIVSDWAFGGSLEGRLAQGGPGLGWKYRVRVAAEAGTGLALLHGLTPPLAHGSLHPRNVLLDGEGRAQLADVGLGTAAQEGGGAGPEGDVHALGALMLRLLGVGGSEGDVVARARAAQSDPTLSALVGSGRAGSDWPSPESLGFAHLALKCVGPDPGSRPDLRSVVLPALLQLHNRTRLYGDGPAPVAALPQEKEDEAAHMPPGFVCPITQDLMADPCVAADGFSYERIAIQEWISRFTAAGRPARSPLTNPPLPHPNVVPNNVLRQQIRRWQEDRHTRTHLPPSPPLPSTPLPSDIVPGQCFTRPPYRCLTFDDDGSTLDLHFIGYEGTYGTLAWSNTFAALGAARPNTGYTAAMKSAPFVAYNSFGNPGSFYKEDGSRFDFVGAWVASATLASQNIIFECYQAGKLASTASFPVTRSSAVWVTTPSLTSCERIVFRGDGRPNPSAGFWNEVILDNLQIRDASLDACLKDSSNYCGPSAVCNTKGTGPSCLCRDSNLAFDPSTRECKGYDQRQGQVDQPSAANQGLASCAATAPEFRLYTVDAIHAATQGFSDARLVGRGPSGSAVYRGDLDGAAVAVKRMGPAAPGAVGPDLEAAARVLASLQLPHVLRVLGCCPEQHVIVYDWAFGGSLEGRLAPGGPGLGWKYRVRVAAEAGTGLALLHGLTPPLTHGSLHPRNVLLDGEGRAQLADVGLGTAAQEGGGAGPEGDVHALGVLMLRLLGVGGSEGDVLARARAAQSDPTLSALVGSGRAGDWPSPESLGFAHLALKCVGPDPGSRPDLRSVVLPALLQLHNRTRLYGDGPAGPAAAAALQQEEEDSISQIPSGFVCPITQDLMANPCVAADGFSYERIAIQEWISRFTADGHPARSPLTNLPLEHPHLVPNDILRQQIEQWQEEQHTWTVVTVQDMFTS